MKKATKTKTDVQYTMLQLNQRAQTDEIDKEKEEAKTASPACLSSATYRH